MYLVAAKRMMLGQLDAASVRASSDIEIRKLANEHGILGYTYLDVDALGSYGHAISLITNKGLTPDFVLCREVYDPEAQAKLAQIVPVVSRFPKLDKSHFISACERALREGRMTSNQVEAAVKNAPKDTNWTSLIAQANLYKPQSEPRKAYVSTASQGSLYHGKSDKETTSVNPDEVRKFIAHQMNLGLHGSKLKAAILSRYTIQELRQIPEIGRRLAGYEGIQGVYFIDPSIYSDLGKGCAIGAKYFRKQGASYLLASSACTGCIYQTAPAWCSKYCKKIIRQAAADSIRNAVGEKKKQASPVEQAPVEDPVIKYELVADLPIDLDGSKSQEIDVTLPSRSVADE
jgi:hypothetical protein